MFSFLLALFTVNILKICHKFLEHFIEKYKSIIFKGVEIKAKYNMNIHMIKTAVTE